MSTPDVDPRLLAGVKLLERTGAREFQLRYSDDEKPVVWFAVGAWQMDKRGHPVAYGGKLRYETAAAMDPIEAVMRLCAEVLDGGVCTHCGKPSAFMPDPDDLMPGVVCSYAWDPELELFRRGCEAERP